LGGVAILTRTSATGRVPLLRAVRPRVLHGLVLLEPGVHAPAARKTGRLTLRPNAIVHSLIYDERETG
jgi:hypothetical protein